MADAYLNVAERVILASRCPLRPKEIIHRAYAQGLVPWRLHGQRQDKTLHARISEDVAWNPESRFFRTGPGVFFLKEMIGDPKIPEGFKQMYFAPQRQKELRHDHILTLEYASEMPRTRGWFTTTHALAGELDRGRYVYLPYSELPGRRGSAAIHSFVLVFRQDKVLSYRCGKFAPSTDPVYGMRSIGLGGAVYASDRDLLFESMHGIVGSGINELVYGIGLPRQLSERARYQNEIKPYLCSLLPPTDTRPAVLHVVMAYECPGEFLPSKAALSINDLRWVPAANASDDLGDYDETSRQLFLGDEVARIRAEITSRGWPQ